MGFWQGLYAAQSAEMERDAVAAENEKSRAYDREKFQEQLKEGYRDNLFALRLKRSEASTPAAEVAAKAQSVISRLAGVDDPRVDALRNNPVAAAELADKLDALEVERAKNDLDLPPMTGTDLLDMTTIILPNTGEIKVVDVSLEDIASVSSRDDYERMALELASPTGTGGGYVKIDPEAYRVPNPKNLEEGRKAFDLEVLRAANDALEKVSGDVTASAELETLMAGYAKEGSSERFKLMKMFGRDAAKSLVMMNNPYIQDIQRDAILSPYSIISVDNEEEYNALPSGTKYVHPDGTIKRKM